MTGPGFQHPPRNHALGVLRLIDPRHPWPALLDASGVLALENYADAALHALRAKSRVLDEHGPALPADTSCTRFYARHVGVGYRIANVALGISRNRVTERAHAALTDAVAAGMACRAAGVGGDPAGTLLNRDPSDLWDLLALDAARWSLISLGEPPSRQRITELLNRTGWMHLPGDDPRVSAGSRRPRHDGWVLPQPRPHRDLSPSGITTDVLIVSYGTTWTTEAFTLNGTDLSWTELCEAMTSGTPLPEGPARNTGGIGYGFQHELEAAAEIVVTGRAPTRSEAADLVTRIVQNRIMLPVGNVTLTMITIGPDGLEELPPQGDGFTFRAPATLRFIAVAPDRYRAQDAVRAVRQATIDLDLDTAVVTEVTVDRDALPRVVTVDGRPTTS